MTRSLLHAAIPALALFVCLAAAPAPALGATLGANQTGVSGAVDVPAVSLKTWQDSTEQERYAFLLGFVTMLQLERAWQGDHPLPLQQSLVQSWSKGFHGVTLKQLHGAVNEHIAANPGDMNRQVIDVLWYKFAQPKVTEKLDGPEQAKRVKKILRQEKK